MMEGQTSVHTLTDALLVLQIPSSPFEDRLNALRVLSALATSNESDAAGRDESDAAGRDEMDEATRSKVFKVMFDALLELVMSEDRTTDLRKRQLIRAECFIMLSNVLKSQTLFGDAYAKLQISELYAHLQGTQHASSDVALPPTDPNISTESPTRAVPRAQSASGSEQAVMSSSLPAPVTRSASVTSLDSEVADAMQRQPRNMTTRQRTSTRSHRKPIMYETLQSKYQQTKVAHLREKKGLKPRQGVIFGSAYDQENFVPGADPKNWTDTDRRLGYRKERMWFPFSVGLNTSLLPPARQYNDPHGIMPDQIVKEYQQMKALMSYVGDMVMIPPEGAAPISGKPHGRGKEPAPTERGRYEQAMREAVQMWTPLVGANLPDHAKKLIMAQPIASRATPSDKKTEKAPVKSRKTPVKPVGPPEPPKKEAKVVPSTAPRKMASRYDMPANASAKVERSVLVTQKILKELHDMETSGSSRTKASIRG